MKTIYLFLLIFIFSSTTFAAIDSVKVSIYESNIEEGGWEFKTLYADSFSNGLQINRLTQNWMNNSWMNGAMDTYSHDTSGNVSQKLSSTWISNQWQNSRRWIYNYVNGSDLLDVMMQNWDGTMWIDSTLETHYYDSGKDTLILIQRWDNSAWVNYSKTERIFDTDSFLTEQTYINWNTGQLSWINYRKYFYQHDSTGVDTTIIYQEWLGTFWENLDKYSYEFDSLGNITTATQYSWFDATWEPWDQTIYHYNLLNQLMGYDWDCFHGACGPSWGNYEYDLQGNLIYSFGHSESMGGIPREGRWHYYYFGVSDPVYVLTVEDFSMCSGDTLQIGAFSVGGTPPIQYQWNPSAGLSSDTIINPYVFADTTTEYMLVAIDSNGYSDTASILITVRQNPVANIIIQSIDTMSLCNSGMLAADSLQSMGFLWYFNGLQQINPLGYNAAHFPIDENGWYKVRVSSNGCESYDSIEVTDFTNPAPAITISNQCNILTAQSADAVSFQWYRNSVLLPGSIYDTLNVTLNATYSVIVVDSSGCTNSSSPFPFSPIWTTFYSVRSCHDTCNGSISVNVYNAALPVQYMWSNGATTASLYGLCADLYTVTVTDAEGCTASKTDSVRFQPEYAINVISSTVDDSSSCNGVAYVTLNGSIATNYIFEWSDGSNSYSASSLCAGWNTVSITSLYNQCTQSDSFFVSVIPGNDSCSVSLTATTPTCAGYCDAELELSYSGNTPFSPLWINPVNGLNNTSLYNLCPGIYSALMIDGNGCIDTGFVTINDHDSIEGNFTILYANPNEPCSTLVGLELTNDSTPTEIYWQCTGTTGDQAVVCPGICNVTVEDQLGCVAYFAFDVPDSISVCSITAVASGATCNGICDGSATVIPNGVPPFSIQWSTSDTGVTVNNLCPGTYSVTMQDSTGCTSTTAVTITEPTSIVSIISSSYINCECTFLANVTGGTPPYAYQWCDNSTAPQMVNCLAGLCLLQITDANGCQLQDTVMINPPPVLTVTVAGTDASCYGCVDGSINASASGGGAPYIYILNTGDTNSTGIFTGLAAGSYTVCVTDTNNCTVCTPVNVGQPPLVCSVINSVNSILCNGDCNGSMSAVAIGVPPFQFLWSTSDTTVTISNLCAGIYSVVMTDSVGCTDSVSIVLGEPAPLVPSHTTVYGCDSCVTLETIAGGTPPYFYQWCDGSTSPELYFCGPGICILNIVDANGCLVTDTIILNPPPPLILSIQSNGTSCTGCNDGNVTAQANGGTPGYTYELIPGGTNTTGFFPGLPAGDFVLCVTDANNCTVCDTLTVLDDPSGIFSIDKNSSAIVYPNPFTNETILEVNIDLLKYYPEFIISDLLGNILSSTAILQQKTIIARENLPSGVYFYRLRSGQRDIDVGKLFIAD